jgi:hypothetical protein
VAATDARANDGQLCGLGRWFTENDAKVFTTLRTGSRKILCHRGYFFSFDFPASILSAESFFSISSLDVKD